MEDREGGVGDTCVILALTIGISGDGDGPDILRIILMGLNHCCSLCWPMNVQKSTWPSKELLSVYTAVKSLIAQMNCLLLLWLTR